MPQIPILLQIAKLILYLSQGILPLKENRKQHDQEPSQTPGLCSFMSWANEHASFRGADPAGPPQLGASEGGRAPPRESASTKAVLLSVRAQCARAHCASALSASASTCEVSAAAFRNTRTSFRRCPQGPRGALDAISPHSPCGEVALAERGRAEGAGDGYPPRGRDGGPGRGRQMISHSHKNTPLQTVTVS